MAVPRALLVLALGAARAALAWSADAVAQVSAHYAVEADACAADAGCNACATELRQVRAVHVRQKVAKESPAGSATTTVLDLPPLAVNADKVPVEEEAFCAEAAPQHGTMKEPNKARAVMEAGRRAFGVPGDYVEAGVAEGGGSLPLIFYLACTGQLRGRNFHLFDSWQGLPKADLKEDPEDAGFQKHQFFMSFEQFAANVQAYKADYVKLVEKKVPRPSRAMTWDEAWEQVQIHRGLFNETMPFALLDRRVAFLMCDGDMYASNRDCLKSADGKMSQLGWVYHDDYYTFKGAYDAVQEHVKSAAPGTWGPAYMVPVHGGYELLSESTACVPPKDNSGQDGSCGNLLIEAAMWQVLRAESSAPLG